MKTKFTDLKLNKQLLTAIEEAGYKEPTEIQARAIPQILAGHDVLGIAQTGTGKTAAFILPVLMQLKYAQGEDARAVVLVPTRELVIQITEVATQLATYTDLRIVPLYGGVGPKSQIEKLQAGVDIIIATPGRYMDLYLRGEIFTRPLQYLILDEADRMMDMGFMPQIRKILEIIPRKRKNLLFSATFQPRVEALSEEFLESPLKIEIAPSATVAETIEHSLYRLPNFKTKINLLAYLFENLDISKALIFCRTRAIADNVHKFLERKVLGKENIRVIHANKGQNTRINAIEDFSQGNIKALVATDVAARGIDIEQVSHVINFDVPLIYEDYVHRIGRTGRAKAEGVAITFVLMHEEYHLKKIEEIIRMTIPEIPIPSEVKIEETPFEENQAMLRTIDNQRKKEDSTFQGAFHEKKKRTFKTSRRKSRRKR